MERSETIGELAKALAAAQAEIEPAPKQATNPHFRNHYADLSTVWEVCRKPLNSHGLSVIQTPEPIPVVKETDSGIGLRTTLVHSSGEWVSSLLPLLFDKASMQSLGSAITYGRRYALSAMVGIVASEDDDANGAGRAPEPAREQGYPSQARPPAPAERDNGRRPNFDQAPPRKAYDGPERAPSSGKGLFAWAKAQEEKHDVGMLKYLNAFMKLQDMPGRMVELDPDQVAICYAEGMRKLQAVAGSPDRGDAYEEAMAN